MPTPYERYLKGWKLAEEEMTRKKQLGFQEQGLELRERGQELDEDKWDTMQGYYEAQKEKLGRPETPNKPFELWLQNNPTGTAADWFKLNQKTQQPTVTEAAKERYALGLKPSQTPAGRTVQLRKEGYEIDTANDAWLPPTEKAKDEPVGAQFIIKEANKKDMLGRKIYTRAAQVDEMVGIWAKHNENYGVGSVASDNAYVALGLPTPGDRPNLKRDLEQFPADNEREQFLNKVGYKANVVEWILENYSTW